jgi:hypothetical protein
MNFSRVFLFLIFMLSAIGCKQKIVHTSGGGKELSFEQIPHLEKQGTATRLVVEGKPFLLISGELHNSMAGGFKYLKPVWQKLAEKNLNSVIATVSWELIEPEEGKFDFSLVDSTIAGARDANLKLVLIWFASWKNSSSVYIPSWVKKDFVKYPRVRDENNKPLEILSTFGAASADADTRAFKALMHHIREVDNEKHTVVMIQVENEMGVNDHTGEIPGNARRDFCNQADAAYKGAVPGKLIDYLLKNKLSLFPELYKKWSENGFKSSGYWEEVFGKSQFRPDPKEWQFYSFYTEELFMAWNYASYVEKVAAAGKSEYPLPMYVNAWLKQPSTSWPGRYPSGGPLPQVIDIWRAGAPSIDFISPDIYIDEFKWVCDEYTRSGNPLFIPESRGGEDGAARAFYAFGEHDAACFSPFGIDDIINLKNDPIEETYAILQKMAPIILENQGKGTMRGILVDKRTPVQRFELEGYHIEARLAGRENAVAGGIIIQTGKMEFLCAGRALDIFFIPIDKSFRIGIDKVDEGSFESGKWISERRLNGDEVHASTWDGTGLIFPGNKVTIQKISLYEYR